MKYSYCPCTASLSTTCSICNRSIAYYEYANMLIPRITYAYDNDSILICIDCYPFSIDHHNGIIPYSDKLLTNIKIYNNIFADTIPIDEFLRLVKAGSLEI